MPVHRLTPVLLLFAAGTAIANPFADYELVDLSHAYGPDTLYSPASPSRFELKELTHGDTDGGWFYSANLLCTPEHGGTHLDAGCAVAPPHCSLAWSYRPSLCRVSDTC